MKTILMVIFIMLLNSAVSQNCSNIPAKNKKILAYTKSKIGKTIDMDDKELVKAAYMSAGIPKGIGLGESIEYQFDCVYPGDVISLGECETKWKRNDTVFGMTYTCDHYFVIYKVKDLKKGIFQIATIDVNMKDEKVLMIKDFALSYIKKGRSAIIYRPRG